MGQTILAARDQTNVPFNVLVQRDGGIVGLTVDIKIFNGNNLSQFLDFADGVFKDAGHGTPTLNLPAIQATEAPGLYSVDTGFDLSAITVPAAAASLIVRYEITAGGEVGDDFDTIVFNEVVRDAVLSDGVPFDGADVANILADTAAMQPLVDVAISTRSDFDEATDPVELLDTGGAAGTSSEELVDDIWDEINRGADHNIKDSTGKQQRQASTGGIDVDTQPVASLGGASTVELDASESAIDDFILHRYIAITAGTGAGQGRIISAYDGTTKIATVSRPWDVIPDATSFYALLLLGDTFVTSGGIDAASLATSALQAIADHLETLGTNPHGTGSWAGLATAPQAIRDAMKLAPTAGAPAAGSVDEHLDDILADTAAGGAGPWATAVGFETEVSAAARAVTNQGEHDATQAAVALLETEASAATREATNTVEHGATLTAVGLNETEVAAAAREVTNTAEHALTQSTGGPGPWTTFAGGGGLTAQQTRDAMKLAPTGGAPAAGSVDEHLDEILTDTAAIDLRLPSDPADESLQQAAHTATQADIAAVQADTDDIQTRLPALLVGGRMDSDVGNMQTDTVDANALATDAAQEIATVLETTGSNPHGTGVWDGAGGISPQAVRDAMKLAPTGGAPAAGSVDEHLDDILTDTAAGGAGPWASATGFETEVSAAARAVTNQGEHDATQAAVALVETEAAAATREATNTGEHSATLTAVGLNETEVAAAARAAADVAAHALTQSTGGAGPWTTAAAATPQSIRDAMKLSPTGGAPAAGSVDEHLDDILADTAAIEPLTTANLDATVTSRESEAAASGRAAADIAAHGVTQAAVALNETEAAAATREGTNTAEHAATLAAVGLNETEADAATREATNTGEHAATLVAVGLNETEVAAAARAAADVAAHALTQATGGPGPWTTATGSATAQAVRDAMKLAPSPGAPAVGSIDEHLDDTVDYVGLRRLIDVTIAAGSTATEIRTARAEADDFWNNVTILVEESGTGNLVPRRVGAFTLLNGAFYPSEPLPFVPTLGDRFVIISNVQADLGS